MSGTPSVFDQPLDGDINDVAEGLVILIDGDTAPRAISSGQYLFIKNHSTLATGGYHATAAIASGASVSSSNTAADADGIANALDGKVSALNSNIITVSTRIEWLINSGTDVVAASGVALISLYPNKKAIINIEARINTKGTSATYSYGVNADAIAATCGKNITPVAGGTAQFFNADGTLDVNSYGDGGTWMKNGQFWTPARNFNGTSVGGWDSTHFDVGQRISGILYGTWS